MGQPSAQVEFTLTQCCLPVPLSVCLSVCLCVCLSLAVCLSVPVSVSVYMSGCLSVCLSLFRSLSREALHKARLQVGAAKSEQTKLSKNSLIYGNFEFSMQNNIAGIEI